MMTIVVLLLLAGVVAFVVIAALALVCCERIPLWLCVKRNFQGCSYQRQQQRANGFPRPIG